MQNQQVKIYHTASVSQIKQVAMLLKYMFANTPKDIHFEVAENGHISFRNEGLYKMPLTGEMPQNEAEARAAAQRWFANFQTWREKIHQTYKEQYKHPKHSFPDFFHEGLQFVKAEPHYHEKVGNLHHWRVYFAVQNEDSQLLADDYVYLDLHRNNPEILMGCEYCTLPVLRSESVAPIFELTEKQIKSLIYRRGIGDSLVPMLPTAEGEVQVTERGVMRGEGAYELTPGKNYYAHINLLNRTINFYVEILYNKEDKRINIDKLNLRWSNKTIKILPSLKIDNSSFLQKIPKLSGKWNLYFNIKFTGYSSSKFRFSEEDVDAFDEANDEYQKEKQEQIKDTEYYYLNWDKGDLALTQRALNRIRLTKDSFRGEASGVFSHEFGHMINIIIDDSEIETVSIENSKGGMNPLYKASTPKWMYEYDPSIFGESGPPIMSYISESDDKPDNRSVWEFEYLIVALRALDYFAQRINYNNDKLKIIKDVYIKRKPHNKFESTNKGFPNEGSQDSYTPNIVISELSDSDLKLKVLLRDFNNRPL